MATKKKKSTRTTKKTVAKATTRKAASRTSCKKGSKGVSPTEKWHVYIVTALSFVAAILLCLDVAMINVA